MYLTHSFDNRFTCILIIYFTGAAFLVRTTWKATCTLDTIYIFKEKGMWREQTARKSHMYGPLLAFMTDCHWL
jgi:hypothetical protein